MIETKAKTAGLAQQALPVTPVMEAIHLYLDQHTDCTEHELIKHCQSLKVEPFNLLDLRQSRELFCAHFLMMHALFMLQDDYFEKQSHTLEITATYVRRIPVAISSETSSSSVSEHSPLKTYYLDIRHYFETSEDEVNNLLTGFWSKFLSQDEKKSALDILELPYDSDYQTIKKRYKELAQKLHPDKGGTEGEFKRISSAKRILDQLYR